MFFCFFILLSSVVPNAGCGRCPEGTFWAVDSITRGDMPNPRRLVRDSNLYTNLRLPGPPPLTHGGPFERKTKVEVILLSAIYIHE